MSKEYSTVGKSVEKRDGKKIVTGSLKYSNDLDFPNALKAKILRSPKASAKIVDIRTDKAEALDGVREIITHKDITDKVWKDGAMNFKRPVMNSEVRYVGEEVAAVAAEDERTAEKALDLIEVEYEEMPAVFDLEKAMEEDAPQIRPDGNTRFPYTVDWGDIEEGFEEAEHIVKHESRIGQQQHAPLQPLASVAKWSEYETPKLKLWTSTQTPSQLNDHLCDYFDLSRQEVRVIAFPCGGSFGLWWENNSHFIASILSRRTGRPVRIELTREEVFLEKRRERAVTTAKVGLKENGTFTSIQLKHNFDNGAYGNKVVPYGLPHGSYEPENGEYTYEATATNLVTGGCMRGVGSVTVPYCQEQLVDKAAEKLDMDPVKIRKKNSKKPGDTTRGPGPCHPGKLANMALNKCLEKGAKAIEWDKKWKGWRNPVKVEGPKKVGIGVASLNHRIHGAGEFALGTSTVDVVVNSDGTVTLRTNLGRQGQSSETTHAQIVAEELGVPIENVHGIHGDTQHCGWAAATVAQLSARYIGLATKAAAKDAKEQLLDIASRILEVDSEVLDIEDGVIYDKDEPDNSMTIKETLQGQYEKGRALPKLAGPPPQTIIGRAWKSVRRSPMMSAAVAHFAEVEVDTETGEIDVLNYVAAHDSGKIINPKEAENQVIGGVMMGLGITFSENLEFDMETGKPINPDFTDYKIQGSLDAPDNLEVIFVESENDIGPFGAKGLGECTNTAPAPAIVNAVYNAVGKRIDTPLTPSRVLESLEE